MKRYLWEDWPETIEEVRKLPTVQLRTLEGRALKPPGAKIIILAELLCRENEQPLAQAIAATSSGIDKTSRTAMWAVVGAVISAVASLISAWVAYLNWLRPNK